MTRIKPSEITPENLYLSRRAFVARLSAATLGPIALSACGIGRSRLTTGAADGPPTAGSVGPGGPHPLDPAGGPHTDELGDPLTGFEAATTYTNYYEFSVDKAAPSHLARNLVTSPWAVQVGGLVARPGTYDLDDLRRRFDQEERVYRLRCVEGWSMVIPWAGFPLAKLLHEVEPTSRAKYVRFETLHDPTQMPGLTRVRLDWPYVEGLRLDEAMHDLTLLATGMYGRPLPPQNGAPIRLVVPWKYGYKSIKSIVKIELVEDMPVTTWPAALPHEYDFYANVNPEADHPRWSQASERRIGELRRRQTLLLNGYAEQVARLYGDGRGLGRLRDVR